MGRKRVEKPSVPKEKSAKNGEIIKLLDKDGSSRCQSPSGHGLRLSSGSEADVEVIEVSPGNKGSEEHQESGARRTEYSKHAKISDVDVRTLRSFKRKKSPESALEGLVWAGIREGGSPLGGVTTPITVASSTTVLSEESSRKLHQTPVVNIGRSSLPVTGVSRHTKTIGTSSCIDTTAACDSRRRSTPSAAVRGLAEAGRSFTKTVESHREGMNLSSFSSGRGPSRQRSSTRIAERKSEFDPIAERKSESDPSFETVADDVLADDRPESCAARVTTPLTSSVPIYRKKVRNPFAKNKQTSEGAESDRLRAGDSSSDDDFDELGKTLKSSNDSLFDQVKRQSKLTASNRREGISGPLRRRPLKDVATSDSNVSSFYGRDPLLDSPGSDWLTTRKQPCLRTNMGGLLCGKGSAADVLQSHNVRRKNQLQVKGGATRTRKTTKKEISVGDSADNPVVCLSEEENDKETPMDWAESASPVPQPTEKKRLSLKQKRPHLSTPDEFTNNIYLEVTQAQIGRLVTKVLDTVEYEGDQFQVSVDYQGKSVTLRFYPEDVKECKMNLSDDEPYIILLQLVPLRYLAWCRNLKVKFELKDSKFFHHSSEAVCKQHLVLFVEKKPDAISVSNLEKLLEGKLHTISSREASELVKLVQVDEAPEKKDASSIARRTRSQTSSEIKIIQNPHQIVLVYQPSGSKVSISITAGDLDCLDDGEYLNDKIIDFYLHYLWYNLQELRARVHVFSSFFHSRLSNSSLDCSKDKNTPERIHHRVQSWTKNINLFDKDFIIVPVCHRAHWFVAIVCYPGLFDPSTVVKAPRKRRINKRSSPKKKVKRLAANSAGKGRGLDSSLPKDVLQVDCTGKPLSSANEISDERSVSSEKPEVSLVPSNEINDGDVVMETAEESSSTGVESMQVCSESATAFGAVEIIASQEEDEGMDASNSGRNTKREPSEEKSFIAELKEESLLDSELATSHSSEEFFLVASSSSGAIEAQEKADEPTKEQQSCIIVLDSLGVKRRMVAQQLKKYLTVEWFTKREYQGEPLQFDTIPISTPSAPMQDNSSDCGIFLLQYVENLLTRLKDRSVPCIPSNPRDWASYSQTNRKRADIRQLIVNLAKEEQSKKEKDEQLPSTEDPLRQSKERSSSSSPLPPGLPSTDPSDSLT